MVHAGADITANLVLNATDFIDNLKSTSTAVTKFKDSMMDLGKDSTVVNQGLQNLLKTIPQLLSELNKFGADGLDKNIARFNKFSLAIEHMALAAQRLAIDSKQGGIGIQSLTEVMNIWEAGVSSAEIKVTGLATALRNMKVSTQETGTTVKSEFEQMKQALNALAMDIARTGNVLTEQEARAVYNAQMLKQEYGVALNSVGTSFLNLNTTMQSWKSLTDSIVNSTTQNVVTSTEKVKVSLGNISTSTSNVTTSLNTVVGSLGEVGTALNTTTSTSLKFSGEVDRLRVSINSSKMSMINWAEVMSSFSTKVNLAKMTLVNLTESIVGTTTRVNMQKATLIDLWNVYARGNTVINPTVSSLEMMNSALVQNRNSVMALITGQNQETVSLERNSIALRENGAERLRAMGYTGKLTIEEEKETASVEQNTQSHYRNANAMGQSSARANQLTSATSRLGKALSSLRMIGTMVGSMLAYNFAHKLLVATGETIHAKSEMEGYFKMLHFGQSEVDDFNKALDDTVKQFQRVNKYSLGETISSIGVEFNLTTEEMKKAMRVTSMITSEYLRAGRNANEASLAVKDVLQGQFQRLSRETGVKGEQLKDAGWSGDTTDVLGLMEALEKVGESRNWDVFAEKANSLNDILTISQNRFGEWSAELVNVVQPTILAVFNSFLSFSQGVAQGLSNIWEWLNTDGWGQTAVKIGAIGTALLTTSQMLVLYRTNLGLVEATQLGLKNTIASLVLGLKGQELAEIGVRNAILSKILGVKAETIAETGVTNAIREKIVMSRMDTVAEKLNTLSSEENTIAKKRNAIEKQIELAFTKGLITQKEKETLINELNTASTVQQTTANGGLLASLYLLGTGEELVTGTTIGLSEAMGILNGVFMVSPVGWITAGILALAGAFYVLSGGLDKVWGQMKQFNEAVDSGYDYLKPYQQQMAKLEKENKTNTEEYDDLNKALEKNKDLIQQGTAQKKRAEEQYQGLNATIDTHLQNMMESANISQEVIDKTSSLSEAIQVGKDKYYRSMQIMTAQTKDFDKDATKLIKTMGSQGKSSEELGKSLATLSGHYADLETHSYIANTTDDYWEKMWNLLYAKMDQFWIDWDLFWADPNWGDALQGFWNAINFVIPWTNLINEFNDAIKEKGLIGVIMDSINDEDSAFINDALEQYIAKPIRDWVTWFLEDPSAHFEQVTDSMSLALAKFLFGDDETSTVKDMTDQWFKDNIVKPIEDSINDFINNPPDYIGEGKFTFGGIGALTSFLPQILFGEGTNLKDIDANIQKWFEENVLVYLNEGVQYISDFINGGEWLSWLTNIDILGMIFDAILPDPVSASDGSSDHPDVGTEMYQVIVQPIVDGWNWFVDGLMSDPFGTLGIVMPSINLAQMLFEGLFGATGGLNLGDWLNSIFDISGWISSFTSNLGGIVSSVTSTASTVISSFDSMKNTVSTNITNIVTTATQGFQSAYNNARTSLTNMRDTTSQVVSAMVNAWNRMKDSILNCAKQIWDGVTKRFSEIGDTIKGFYQKIQNPSQWGSSGSASLRSGTPKPSTGRAVARTITGRGYSGGRGRDAPTGTMTISSLKRMICPNGNCGNLFDGFNGSDVVDVPTFLALVGDGHGFGGWNFSDKHLSHIRTTTNKWDTGSPIINLLGGIATSTKFKVGEFEDGTPKISWEAFQSMAQAIFSAIPYRFYTDSSWKGSWLGALEAGACNCYDGALALIAFANACGFGGSMEHGTWTDPDGTQYPHVWAVINGKKMDTTAWQQRGSWSAGSPTVSSRPPSNNNNKTPVTINITMGDVYGVDDLNRQIEDGIDKGLQKHFNDSYALGV